jgi:hypothetical protein
LCKKGGVYGACSCTQSNEGTDSKLKCTLGYIFHRRNSYLLENKFFGYASKSGTGARFAVGLFNIKDYEIELLLTIIVTYSNTSSC